MKNLNDDDRIELLSSFIDDLNNERKPSYRDMEDQELSELFETVKAVKRLKPSTKNNKKSKKLSIAKFNNIRLARFIAVASIILILGLAAQMLNIPSSPNNIVLAMVEAYEKLVSYSGVIEIRSLNNGEVDFLETIEVKYKKPNKFLAEHQYGDTQFTQMSDGDALYTIEGNNVVVDYSNPEKELWRYHIGQQIAELQHANNIEKIGVGEVAGRKATIYQYGIADDNNSHKVWIDDKTKLPLQTELILPEDRRLLNRFISIEINPVIADSTFTFQANEAMNVVELNKKVDIEEANAFWPVDKQQIAKLTKELQNRDLILEKAIMLDDNLWYKYLLKFKDTNNDKFVDIYLADKVISNTYSEESIVGMLGNGWVELNSEAINVFKVYIGKSTLVRWVIDNNELAIISNLELTATKELLEASFGKNIIIVTKAELEKLGVESPITKEGH